MNNCFVGVPVPGEIVKKISNLQDSISQILQTWEVANSKIVHMTLYYLGTQSSESLSEIASRVRLHSEFLQNESVKLGELGLFTPDEPRVVYLRAKCSTHVEQFYRIMVEELSSFRKEDADRDFAGHVTLGRLRNVTSVEDFRKVAKQIEQLCEVRWDFVIDEVGVYGISVDSKEKGQTVWQSIKVF